MIASSNPRRTRAANGRSSIVQERDGRWHGYVSMGHNPDGRPVRRHVSARTRTETTRKVRVLEQERQANGTAAFGRSPTVAAYLTDWIGKRSLDVRPKTIAGYQTDAKHIIASIGDVQLIKLSAAHVTRLWQTMIAGDRLPSIAHVRRTLNAALVDAVNQGLLPSNPIPQARTPRHYSPEMQVYTVEEVRAFLAHAATGRNAVRWTLAAVMGLRQGEALGLRWEHTDLAIGTLTIEQQLQRQAWKHGCVAGSCGKRAAGCPHRFGGGLVTRPPKSRAGQRTIVLPPTVQAQLAEHRVAQRAEAGITGSPDGFEWVFSSPLGKPIDPRRDWQDCKDIARAAGLKPIRVHDLRHTAATLLLEAQTDLKTAGQVLGHSNVGQTSNYVHVLRNRQTAAALNLGALVWPRAIKTPK